MEKQHVLAMHQRAEQETQVLAQRLQVEEQLSQISRGTSSLTGARWEFETGPNRWTSMPTDTGKQLDEEYKKGGHGRVCVESGVHNYEFDLGAGQSAANLTCPHIGIAL